VILIENVAVATVDAAGTEYADGHVVVGDDGRIVTVGSALHVEQGTDAIQAIHELADSRYPEQ
jgi:cytosine/adenosine deaminase-related metal-dependent hydrolase